MDKIKIRIIIGLGNPGKEYENTRHNIGFIFIDLVSQLIKSPKFEFKKLLNADITTADKKLILAKPQTFMNNSGSAVAALMKFYKTKPENILIVQDDIDILWGDYKLSFGRSSAGHKGIESIIKSIKTKNFWRLRIGIQPRISKIGNKNKRIKADDIILKKFTPLEKEQLKNVILDAANNLLKN